jgi:hypothetical protein
MGSAKDLIYEIDQQKADVVNASKVGLQIRTYQRWIEDVYPDQDDETITVYVFNKDTPKSTLRRMGADNTGTVRRGPLD